MPQKPLRLRLSLPVQDAFALTVLQMLPTTGTSVERAG